MRRAASVRWLWSKRVSALSCPPAFSALATAPLGSLPLRGHGCPSKFAWVWAARGHHRHLHWPLSPFGPSATWHRQRSRRSGPPSPARASAPPASGRGRSGWPRTVRSQSTCWSNRWRAQRAHASSVSPPREYTGTGHLARAAAALREGSAVKPQRLHSHPPGQRIRSCSAWRSRQEGPGPAPLCTGSG